MKLRVRLKDLSTDVLLNTLAIPELPDWQINLPDQLPEQFSGKALVFVGAFEVTVTWDFSSGLVAELMERLRCSEDLDSVSTWGPVTLQACMQGNETTVKGQIGIMVER